MTIDISDEYIQQIESGRRRFVSKFTREFLSTMTLEQYVMGDRDKDSFCYRIEVEQAEMGNIRGVMKGVQRYGVWYNKKTRGYDFTLKYGETPQEAFLSVRRYICDLLDAGEKDDYIAIGHNKLAGLFKYKILAMYFPHKYLTIYSPSHLSYFCDKVGIPAIEGDDELVMQRKLLQWKDIQDEARDMSLIKFSRYLYFEFDHPPKREWNNKSRFKLKALRDDLKDFDEKHPKRTLTEVLVTQRSNKVKSYAKLRADGVCELCKKPAPFYTKHGEAYLEVHHIIPLKDNGPDETSNVVALCPNCHRKMHSLGEPADVVRLKRVARR